MLYIIPYPSMGQDKGITLNMKNAEATLIFLKIEQQSSYKFFYKTEQIKQLKNISIQVRNAPIKNVLDEIFNGTNFTYEITGEQIVVLEKKTEKKELITVTGNVKDTKGETIIGVAIVIKGTTSGVVTDINGNFSIKAAPDNILQFRFLGMKDKDLPIPANHQLNVIMEDDSRVIEEVVVTGYGDFKKSSYTGSASVVNMDKMKSLPVVSVTQMLEANLPGVSLYSNSGQPGSNVSMRIRGIGSFNASNEPLYVLDGVPITSGNMSSNDMNTGGLGFISTLNPADIENITVLKDAASASLRGKG
ncbi:MAG: TonB-dependent receptor plug domain-containing protein [Butyricimonas paravirosa]